MKLNKTPIVIISIIFLIYAVVFYAKTSNIMIDVSREALIPYRILNGEAIYKDIFTIYGVFGYFFNAILYKIFGVSIDVINIESNIIAFLTSILFYFISRKFLAIKESLLLTIIFITVNIFSCSTFSFVLPYSYSTLWAYFASFLALVLFLNNKYKFAFLVLGFISICRFEIFLPLFICLILFTLLRTKEKLKTSLFSFVFPFIAIMGLFLSHIQIQDYLKNYSYMANMVSSKSLKIFYTNLGVYFNKLYFLHNLKYFIIFSFVFFISYFLYKNNKKLISILFLVLFFLIFKIDSFSNLMILFLLYPLGIFLYKRKKNNNKYILLFIFSFILCFKNILAINYYNYANYAMALMLLLIYVSYKKIVKREWLFIIFAIFLIFLNMSNFNYFIKQSKKIVNSNIGKISLTSDDYVIYQGVSKFLDNNLKNNETFLVLPEGQLFNLIYKVSYPYYNTSFTPLDFDTFKEDKLKADLNLYKPTYIIFFPRNTLEYGAGVICLDYAQNFCSYIIDNYSRVAIIEGKYNALIFKRND